MEVKNINGMDDNTCKCASWLDHWKNFGEGRFIPAFCPVRKCLEKPEIGARVQKDGFTDDSWYIVPLCKLHNGKTGESISISDLVELVSANVSSTCGKK